MDKEVKKELDRLCQQIVLQERGGDRLVRQLRLKYWMEDLLTQPYLTANMFVSYRVFGTEDSFGRN